LGNLWQHVDCVHHATELIIRLSEITFDGLFNVQDLSNELLPVVYPALFTGLQDGVSGIFSRKVKYLNDLLKAS